MNTLRLGIIGTGSVVREIYQYLYFRSAYAGIFAVQAACDIDQASLKWFSEEWKVQKTYTDYREMIEREDLDVVAVNTPDSLHLAPVLFALENGLDVLLPKPTADKVGDVHRMIRAAREQGRFLGVDYHKRGDPVVKEARARFRAGEYGKLQTSTWYMLDRLLVADPNHSPRFFASPDFAAKNSPVSFLTSHMADTFITITGLKPISVRANGYKHKLPSLEPISVDGYDLVDTEVISEDGSTTHIITGWALPNPAHGLTVQTGRMIFSEGMIDLWNEEYGYREITAKGIDERNVLFRNFEEDGTVSGYGMSSPGKLAELMQRHRAGNMDAAELESHLSPLALGFYATLICECAHISLAKGNEGAPGAVIGEPVDALEVLKDSIGGDSAEYYP